MCRHGSRLAYDRRVPTIREPINALRPDPHVVAAAAAILGDGGLVAFPTETVYGLGALATDFDSVQRVFVAKGRPTNDPLIVHVHPEWALDVAFDEPDVLLRDLARRWWPGPLTLVGTRGGDIVATVSGGLSTVAVRSPAHPVALALLEALGQPIAAPSANRFGHVSPTHAQHVVDDLDGRLDMILDAGETTLGIESTIVRPRDGVLEILRLGSFVLDDLRGFDLVDCTAATSTSAGSPGSGFRHYAPETPMVVVDSGYDGALPDGGGVYLGYDDSHIPSHWEFVSLGDRVELSVVAASLYARLRDADRRGPQMFVAELTGLPGLGRAIDDRLTRAAAGRHHR